MVHHALFSMSYICLGASWLHDLGCAVVVMDHDAAIYACGALSPSMVKFQRAH